jgi:N-acetylmuramic acid 6-phosphate etherase
MVRLGKVYENLMVDLRATNTKLRDRAVRIVCTVTGADRPTAEALLDRAEGRVKVAIVMHQKGVDADVARALLDSAGGHLRRTLVS